LPHFNPVGDDNEVDESIPLLYDDVGVTVCPSKVDVISRRGIVARIGVTVYTLKLTKKCDVIENGPFNSIVTVK
jgi:hypothetical protein